MRNIYLAIAMILVLGLGLFAINDGKEKTVETTNEKIFSADQDHYITTEEAKEMVRGYNKDMPAGMSRVGGFFGRDAIEAILAQDDVVGIQYFYGRDDEDNVVLVLIGTTAEGEIKLDGVLAEKSLPCPPWCGVICELIGINCPEEGDDSVALSE